MHGEPPPRDYKRREKYVRVGNVPNSALYETDILRSQLFPVTCRPSAPIPLSFVRIARTPDLEPARFQIVTVH